jgi:DNA primase
MRGAELLLAAGLGVRIATVPSGKDPDEHLHAFGAEAFKKDCLAKAVDLVEFKTEILLKRAGEPLTPEKKSAVAKEVLLTISQCPDEILKSEWTRRLAQRLDVGETALQKQLDKTAPARTHAKPAAAPQVPAELTQGDEQLLVLMLKDAKLASLADESDLVSTAARTIWTGLKAVQGTADWSARLLEALPPAEKTTASRLLVLVGELQSGEPAAVLKKILSQRRGLTRLKEIEPKVLAGDSGFAEEYKKLLSELKGSRR